MSARVLRRRSKRVTVVVDAAMHAKLRAAATRAGMPVAALARAFFELGLETLERGGAVEGVGDARVRRTVRGSRDTDAKLVR